MLPLSCALHCYIGAELWLVNHVHRLMPVHTVNRRSCLTQVCPGGWC